jgi:hypothetical protein
LLQCPCRLVWRLVSIGRTSVCSVTSYSLTPLGYNPGQVRRVLLRLALSDSTAPAIAVMQSLLGLASLHRFGPQSQADRLKISALRTLAASLTDDINAKEGIQYIAAGMLLCSYEVRRQMLRPPSLKQVSMVIILTLYCTGPAVFRYIWRISFAYPWS